ncbi:alpha/beta fold hydrolase [Kribbella antibiotica]|uniref:Alpha/beta fold hydrolase n=1 Tax=Kribbella antibiotica TaxID=190195 RepID=A0A4R4ZCV9_9ACTN|nr:lipase family protein [Kribbella antibiotica]TDD54162.1 alpha/beta fold hydrolase [Kribbella antibiotica]
MLRRLVTGLAIAGLSLAVAAPAEADSRPPTPQNDPFYTAPSPLPSVAAGDVLKTRKVDLYVDILRLFPVPTRADQVLYRSTSATGTPNAVSGTVITPLTAWTGSGKRPVLAYAMGTQGLGDQCAPSYQIRTGTEVEVAFIAQAITKGWAVALTDYEGLGTPGTHTYANAKSEGRALLDVARAATRLPAAGLDKAAPIGVFGYSQGGQAAAAAAEQAASYAPDLKVVGTATGGVPADLDLVAASNDGGIGFGLVAAAAIGLSTAYSDVPLDNVLTAQGKELFAKIKQACVAEIALLAPGRKLDDFTTVPNVIKDPRWQKRLNENLLGNVKPSAPVYLYHGTADELIPYAGAVALKNRYCAAGTTLEWHVIPLGGHVVTVSLWGTNALNWLGDRFQNRPATSSC